MKKLLSLSFVCALIGLSGFAHAQQTDLAVGGNTLWSPKSMTASVGFLPPPEKGGTYPSFSLQHMLRKRVGFNAEVALRYHQALYNAFQPYRPILYDVNAVYAPPLARKTTGDFMAGLGLESLLFYNAAGACGIPTGGCRTFVNSNHFLLHFGAGVRYNLWRKVFIRPEVHWYVIHNNFEFHSDNVFRVGASIGYTFHGSSDSTKAKPTKPAK